MDLGKIAAEIDKRLSRIPESPTVAVMGCMVNGPGEAKEADIGVACGHGSGVIFRGGKLIRRIPEKKIAAELMKEIDKLVPTKE